MDGSEEAFVRLYRAQYRPLVAFFVRRVDDVELARDLTAETFRIAWTRRGDGPFDRAWLFGVARNLIGDEYRRRSRERTRLATDRPTAPTGNPDDPSLDVQDAVDRLPLVHREVLTLTYWDGLDAGEIARLLGVSRSAVWMRLYRARRAFALEWGAAPPPTHERHEGAAR